MSISVAHWTVSLLIVCLLDDLLFTLDFRHLPSWQFFGAFPTPCQKRLSRPGFSLLGAWE